MTIKIKTKTKVLCFAGLLAVSIAALTWLGYKTVHTELVIPASPAAVWSVLTDAPGYKEWNPVFVSVEGDYRQGAKMAYRMRDANGKESAVTATVVTLTEGQEMNQFGGIPGILTFDHSWLLDPVDGGTRVTQHEEYRGIGVWFWDASWVEPAYSKANEALRDRVHLGTEDRRLSSLLRHRRR